MPKYAREILFNGSIDTVSTENYDSSKITVGPHIAQYNLGSSPEDKYIGPKQLKLIRQFDLFAAASACFHVFKYGRKHIMLVGSAATAAATRIVYTHIYDLDTEEVTSGGALTLTLPTTTAHTLRGIRGVMKFYTTGTVGVSGTTVTGSGTSWQASRLCAGSRIGFGSTNSSEITTWYEIASINSDSSITLLQSAGTIATSTPYVIEDLRVAVTTTNATLLNGGFFLAKGLRIESLTGGAIVPAATTVDNIRAVYRLADAATVTHTIANGLMNGEDVSWTEDYLYSGNSTTTTALRVFKYNIRAALTSLSAGTHVLDPADCISTGSQTVSGGTLAIANNGRFATVNHGVAKDIPSLYFATTNRVIRAATSNIVQDASAFTDDQMIESPYGGTSNYTLTAGIGGIEYAPFSDKILMSAFVANNAKIYVSDYRTDGSQFDGQLLTVTQQFDAISSTGPIFPKIHSIAPQLYAEDGVLYIVNPIAVSLGGSIYIYPAYAAHWAIADKTGNRAILPKISLTGTPKRFNRVYLGKVDWVSTLPELLKQTEPVRVVYRTEGIDDNSGSWILIPQSGTISGIEPTTEIQFALEFHTWGDICIPSRVTSFSMIYEADDSLPDEYQWNLGDSNISDGTFGFTQVAAFTSWPTVHTMKIYRSDNNTIALEQTSESTTLGVFEYWDGSEWTAGLGDNLTGSRRRFRPTSSLPGGLDLYGILTVE
jgi:hypothetical protein